ncbi:MAG: ribosome recycling factor [Candidatus Paceibacterota bacterium]
MTYNFSSLKKKTEEITHWLKGELAVVRTGRATPAILDAVRVESYGSKLPLNHRANITIENPRTLRVVPWDRGQIKDIEKALLLADLGVSVSANEESVLVSFPELTSERREALLKVALGKLEEAKISLRGARDEVWQDIQKKEKEGEISEDDKFRFKEEMEKIISACTDEFEAMTERKKKEISR